MESSSGAEWWRPSPVPGPGLLRVVTAPARDTIVPFGVLMLFTLILLLSPQTVIPVLSRFRIALLTGVVGVVAHAWTCFSARRPLIRSTREIRLVAALLGWAVVTIPLSEYVSGSVAILLDLYLKALIIFWLLSNTVSTLGRLRIVAWALSLMAIPLSVTALWNFHSHHGVLGRIVGYEGALTGNPNDLALMLNLILPLTGALLLVNPRSATRGLLVGLMVLDASAIIVTFSRGGLLTLLTSFILYMGTLLRWRRRKWAVLAGALGLAATMFLPPDYMSRVGTITNISADPTGSAQTRWQDTKVALDFALSHPFIGAGLGMNVLALNRLRGPSWLPVHNVYLEYAMDLGWIGLGLFLALLVSCVRSAGRVRERTLGLPALQELSGLAEGIRISLVTFAVAAFFHPVAYHFYFFYFAALAVAADAVYEYEVSVGTATSASFMR